MSELTLVKFPGSPRRVIPKSPAVEAMEWLAREKPASAEIVGGLAIDVIGKTDPALAGRLERELAAWYRKFGTEW